MKLADSTLTRTLKMTPTGAKAPGTFRFLDCIKPDAVSNSPSRVGKMTPTKNARTADDEDEARGLDLDSKADVHARRAA